jgi:protein gp37
MGNTKIEWATKVWNPVTGCTYGCVWCYARKFAERMRHNPNAKISHKYRFGFTPTFHPEECVPEKMKQFKKGEFVFVPSMGDIFDPSFNYEERLNIFEAISCSEATFLILTKRPDIMKEFFSSLEDFDSSEWNNVWLGVSVTNQNDAMGRIPILLQIPAAIHFISAEPLLDFISFSEIPAGIDWIISGGLTGNGAKPCIPESIELMLKTCEIFKIPFFFKGWGGEKKHDDKIAGKQYHQFPTLK